MRHLLALVLLAALPVLAQDLGPEELVKKITDDVMSSIQSDKQLAAGDKQKAIKLAEEKILPYVDIGRGVVLRRVVVDKDCRLPPGLSAGLDPDEDRRRFHVTPKGVTLISPQMLS